MIDQVKKHVEGCGGETQLVTIGSEDGRIENFSQDKVKPETERLQSIDAAARHILGVTIGIFNSEEQFDILLKDTCKPLYKLAKIADKPKTEGQK